VKSKSHE
jgi:hypothetical protein